MITICEGGSIAFEAEGENAMLGLGESIARYNNGDKGAALELLLFALIDAQAKQNQIINDSVAQAISQAPTFENVLAQVTGNLPALLKTIEAMGGGNGSGQVSTFHKLDEVG